MKRQITEIFKFMLYLLALGCIALTAYNYFETGHVIVVTTTETRTEIRYIYETPGMEGTYI